MNIKELEKVRKAYLDDKAPYNMIYWTLFNYKVLNNIMYRKKTGIGRSGTYNDCIIAGDTETSKAKGVKKKETKENHVVAWTISIRAYRRNIVTLWGRKPSDMIHVISMIQENLPGDETYIYFFNLSYDWTFLRQFFFKEYKYPSNQLNTKPHYPLFIKWKDRGLVLKDALALAQRRLEKWAEDLQVVHQKAIGYWDYDKYRTQEEDFTDEELQYIENDTLALCECIEATYEAIGKNIYSIPYTATGIVRSEVKAIGKKNHANDKFKRMCLDLFQYETMVKVYHGGFTHANRFWINIILDDEDIICKDFASSYPFCLLSEKFPAGPFKLYDEFETEVDPKDIIAESDNFAFYFKLQLLNFKLKDPLEPMPSLQYYKLEDSINIGPGELDNGRVLSGAYAEIYLTEVDLQIILQQYEAEEMVCTEVYCCSKDYLPRWLTDYIFHLFEEKCRLKNGDPVLYALAKARLNACYGMFVERSIHEDIEETYDYDPESMELVYNRIKLKPEQKKDKYDKYMNSKTNILNYQIGVWVTAYAMRNLILGLGSCINDPKDENGRRTEVSHWIYSDTDSIFSDSWNERKVEMYNELCKIKLRDNGYGPVVIDGKEYWLGIAEEDKVCSEFVTQGAKRYCFRYADTEANRKKDKANKLMITVAGVPKKGVIALKDDISNFVPDLCFKGEDSGKKTHFYLYSDSIHFDEDGNEIADSIDMQPCDYLLDQTEKWEYIESEDICIQLFQ